jgi:hypothetical protein
VVCCPSTVLSGMPVAMATTMIRKLVSLPPELLERITVFRHANRIGFESEAIRLVLEAGLEALAREPKPPGPKDADQ